MQDKLREIWRSLLKELEEAPPLHTLSVWPADAPAAPIGSQLAFNARAMLEAMGIPHIEERKLNSAIHLAPQILMRRERTYDWVSVGVGRRALLLQADWAAVRRASLNAFEDRAMAWGLLLAMAWRTSTGRVLLGASAWRTQLVGRLPDTAARTSVKDKRHQGWIRYILHPSNIHVTLHEDPTSFLERQIIRQSKSGSKELKPLKCNDAIKAKTKIKGVQDIDLTMNSLLQRLRHMARSAHSMPYTAAASIRRLHQETLDEVFAGLAKCEDVWWEEEPVTVLDEPIMPELLVKSAAEGQPLQMEWRPKLDMVLQIGRGYALNWHGELRPLDKKFPEAMRPLLVESLPQIPRKDFVSFVSEFALPSPVPVHLPEDEELNQKMKSPDRIEPRLFLSEFEGTLRLEARFGYHTALACPEIRAQAPSPVVTGHDDHGKPVMLRRDRQAETKALSQLTSHLSGPLPLDLHTEEAYAFLLDGLPALPSSWTVFGASELRDHKVQGTAEPTMRFSSGVDWFDLDVEFEAGGKKLATGKILESWLAGQKYYKLQDGSVTRLPTQWLTRHAEALAELEDLRRASRKRLGTWAAPLAEGLMDEVEPPSEVEEVGLEGPVSLGTLATWKQHARHMASFEGIPEFTPRAPVKATLRNYQQEGTRWMAFLRDTHLGGILADDMGLGKTLQTLVLLADTHVDKGPASLVVCPVSVVHNWAKEAARFVPSLKVHIHHGHKRGAIPDDADVVITTFALLRFDKAQLHSRTWRYVVLDEAQQIKNPDSQTAKAARDLESMHRLALTGTPMENHLLELWSIFQFVLPGFFGSRQAFIKRYAKPIQDERDADALARLRARIKPFILRRRKSEVCTELPPRQEQILHCDLSVAERGLYESLKTTYRTTVMEKVKEDGIGKAKLAILEALMRLRQSCCHPALVPLDEARVVKRSSKMDLLIDTLEQLIDEGHRALIFSQWPSLLKLARDRCKTRGWPWLYLDGKTKHRQDLVERWNKPEGPPIFFISLKAGGTGLNLTGADCVIHLDPWWNPAVEAQATDRAHRIGQTKPVQVYRFVARNTVEEKIIDLQDRKRALLDAALDTDGDLVTSLTREDLEAIFAPPPAS